MDPALWAALIVKVGIPLAEDILAMIRSKQEVTVENWAALKAKNAIRGEDLIPPRQG